MKNHFYKIFILTFCLLLVSNLSQARSVHYDIGTTGYMIKEAMDAGAATEASADYQQALSLQKQAHEADKKRDLKNAKILTKQAYDLAKSARDQALQNGHQIELHNKRPHGRVTCYE